MSAWALELGRAGRAFLVLADIAYYLVGRRLRARDAPVPDASTEVTRWDVETALASVGGLALLIGVMAGFYIVALPAIARLVAGRPDRDEPP